MSEDLAMQQQQQQAADNEELAGKHLTFYIDDTVYGVSLINVIEIIGILDITVVPGTPDYVKGIINLRGGVVPVIDVRLKFRQPERAYDEHTCIVVINIDDMTVGMIVDSVYEVVTLDNEEASSLPEFTNVNTKKYLRSISRVGDHLVLNMDCQKFLQDDAMGF